MAEADEGAEAIDKEVLKKGAEMSAENYIVMLGAGLTVVALTLMILSGALLERRAKRHRG